MKLGPFKVTVPIDIGTLKINCGHWNWDP